MSIRSFLARFGVKAAAVAALAWAGSSAVASDVTPPAPGTVVAAPVSVGGPGCESCQHGAIRANCNVCGKLLGGHLHKNKKAPYPVTLCPGACFGYFQTQWRKWDEVCPYPYIGVGVGDAPRPPSGVLNPRPTVPGGSDLTPPRPLDPKMTDPKMPDPKAPKAPEKAPEKAPKAPEKPSDPPKVGTTGGGLPAIPVVPNKFGP